MLRGWANKIIYLKADPKELLRRIQADPQSAQTRPNLTNLGGGLEEIRLKLAEREPQYRAIMDSELDVTNLTPAQRTTLRRELQLLANKRPKLDLGQVLIVDMSRGTAKRFTSTR